MKESAAQRRNELLQMALSSPVAQQIMGMEGTAHLLREQVKTLDLNADKIVPAPEILKARAAVAQAQQQQMMQQQMMQEQQRGRRQKIGGGEQLINGQPVVDNFSPTRMAP